MLSLNSEEVREQVGRVEVRGGRLFGFRERFFFFGMLIAVRDRVEVRKLYCSQLRERSAVGSGASLSRASDCSNSTRWRLKPINRPGPIFSGARAGVRSQSS